MARFSFAQLPAFGIGDPPKLTAAQTAAALPRPAGLAPDPRRDIRCEEHARTSDALSGRAGAWDYICTFVPYPDVSQKRVKVGVRVNDTMIRDVSQAYELDVPYVK